MFVEQRKANRASRLQTRRFVDLSRQHVLPLVISIHINTLQLTTTIYLLASHTILTRIGDIAITRSLFNSQRDHIVHETRSPFPYTRTTCSTTAALHFVPDSFAQTRTPLSPRSTHIVRTNFVPETPLLWSSSKPASCVCGCNKHRID